MSKTKVVEDWKVLAVVVVILLNFLRWIHVRRELLEP